MIKNINDFAKIDGFSQMESAILQLNNVDISQIKTLLPDLGKKYNIKEYLEVMEPINKGEEFLDFVEKNKNKKFCVVGDYDCDGIVATVILCYALTLVGIDVTYTISNRFIDGYGMHEHQIDLAIENGAEIIITVDNGIVANEAIDYAHSKNLLVCVTDHHMPQGDNHADIVIDPFYNNEQFKKISGATVAMKLAYLLYKQYNFSENIMNDFVALASITVYSDVMAIENENRIMLNATEGYLNSQVKIPNTFINRLANLLDFYRFNKNSDPYLQLNTLFKAFNKDNIDFYFVPVINACNRVLGDVNELVYDIMSLFVKSYDGIPHFYSGINKKRKIMKSELCRKHKPNDKKAVVELLTPDFWDDDYGGIVGLVASTVVESENKPALIGIDVSSDEDFAHFSGRSLSGFNLFNALTEIKNEHPELEFSFGGHAEALGATCKKRDVPLLEDYLSEKVINIDIPEQTYIEMPDPNEVLSAFANLWPFGNKFEFPKFRLEDEIKFINKEEKYILTKNKRVKIKYFTKEWETNLSKYAFEKKNEMLTMQISVMEDDENNVIFKIEKVL